MKPPPEPPELAEGIEAAQELLALVRGATTPPTVWELAEAEERVLGELSPAARTLALAFWGAGTSHAGEEEWSLVEERIDRRCRYAIAAADLLGEAIAGHIRDVRSLSRLWHDLKHSSESVSFAVAATLAISAEIPLSMDGPGELGGLDDPSLSSLVGIAVGRAARAGCAQAQQVARGSLHALDTGTAHGLHTSLGILKGLGAGLAEDGYGWLATIARRAVFFRDGWASASHTAALLALAARSPRGPDLAAISLALPEDAEVARERLSLLLRAADPNDRAQLFSDLTTSWTRWPPAVRAALLERGGASLAADEPWLLDRSPIVLLEALGQLDSALSPGGGVPEPDPAALRSLIDLLGHPSARVRRGVATILAKLRKADSPPRSLPAPSGAEVVSLPPQNLARTPVDRLHAALWAGESELLAEAVSDLDGDAEIDAAVRALLGAVEIPDMALRRAIVELLGEIGTAELGPALLDIARSYRTLEGLVVAALRQLEAKPSVEELAELFRRRLRWADDQAVDDFCELAGEGAAEHLLGALTTRFYPAARAGAARAIARQGLKECIFALRKMSLSDPHPAARQAANGGLRTLGCSLPPGDELAGYALLFGHIGGLEDAVARAREVGPAALPGIRQTLATGSWKRRRAACEVLQELPGQDALEALIEGLVDTDEDVRLGALQALSNQGWTPRTPRQYTLAAVAARRPWTLVRERRRLDLDTMERCLRLGGHVFRNEVLDALEQVPAWSPPPELGALIRATRLDGRGALREQGGLATLLTVLDRTWQAIPHRARLTRGLFDVSPADLRAGLDQAESGWRAREAVCQALARPNDNEAADVLATLVCDEDDDVRHAALQALARVGTTRAAEAAARGIVSPFEDDRKPVAAALAAIGTRSLPVLNRLAESPWWEARRVAATALGEWRSDRQEAVDILLLLAVDAEHRVSREARRGLEEHGLLPTAAAVRRALAGAQTATVEPILPWLRLGAGRSLEDPRALETLRAALERASEVVLPQRLCLIAALRAPGFRPWLEDYASGRLPGHLGVRLAAALALRELISLSCHLCEGRGSIRCPGCDGDGEQACDACHGRGVVRGACPDPDCNAADVTRAIDSKPCKTCRGRGSVQLACECGSGSVTCDMCRGSGRHRCPLCEGSGDPRPRAI